jgi:hypothetical protein
MLMPTSRELRPNPTMMKPAASTGTERRPIPPAITASAAATTSKEEKIARRPPRRCNMVRAHSRPLIDPTVAQARTRPIVPVPARSLDLIAGSRGPRTPCRYGDPAERERCDDRVAPARQRPFILGAVAVHVRSDQIVRLEPRASDQLTAGRAMGLSSLAPAGSGRARRGSRPLGQRGPGCGRPTTRTARHSRRTRSCYLAAASCVQDLDPGRSIWLERLVVHVTVRDKCRDDID